ncbi:hypothetical protein [Streptomyces sp. NPDC037389]|uniref:hypothetical protein n=1 Tax=Streptomyces sp. NPDC037389 TaxID=3155369 RepID=UPI0033F66252
MDNAISFEELDQITGEVLPERTVMGVIATPLNLVGPGDGGAGAGAGASSSAAASGGGVFAPVPHDHGTTMLSACQTGGHEGTPGLLGEVVGLGRQPAAFMTCVPAAVSSH